MTFAATILTLYPEMFPGPLGQSIAGRALEQGKWSLETVQIRDFAADKHRSVDDTPAGGGAGMVLKVDVLAAAIDAVQGKNAQNRAAHAEPVEAQAVRSIDPSTGSGRADLGGNPILSIDPSTSSGLTENSEASGCSSKHSGRADLREIPILAMSPRGKPLTQARVRELAAGPGVTILCGRFEGFDERIFEGRNVEPVSIGDYVLSGGEIGALVLLDACIRLLPDVMGAASSGDEESFESGLLEYPHYTRPVEWEGRTVPEVLRSGDHAKIAAWRKQQAEADTRSRRPDLWERHVDARDRPTSGAHAKKKD